VLGTTPTKTPATSNIQQAITTLRKEVWQLRSEVDGLTAAVHALRPKSDERVRYKPIFWGFAAAAIAIALSIVLGRLLIVS